MSLPAHHQFNFTAMACRNEIMLAGSYDAASAMAEAVINEVRRIEAKYSRYRDDSVLSRINAAAGADPVQIDQETSKLLDYADAVWRSSHGRFDISSGVLRRAWDFRQARLPAQAQIDALLPLIGWDKIERGADWIRLPQAGMQLDFGGFGKEYAVDCAADLCEAAGWHSGFINLGGDLRVLGPQPDGSPWHIGIRHPRDAGAVLASIALADGALASSGDYERFVDVGGRRYCHILDARSGWPVQGWQSVSVLTPRCLVAGTVSTVAMLKGEAEGEPWLTQLGARVLAVRGDGSTFSTFATQAAESAMR
ncbi:FAD:protein FMN transferase [Chitinimonas sp.]|uniref:FAD:protein FMN transferase n=1 Tax=Chitinimonas sp. TaxID=1934313 RepID=UPI0035B3DEC7